jgi:hypothetical protein
MHQDALQSRLTHSLNSRNQLFGTLAYQRTTTDSANVFGFVDSNRVSGLDVPINWSHRFAPVFSLRVRYQFTQLTRQVTPFFANRENVSGAAGITGNDQAPVNWGPPALTFSSGVAGLSSAPYLSSHDRTHGWMAEALWTRGRHNVTFGGDFKLRRLDILSQQDPVEFFVYRRRDPFRCRRLSARPPARELDRVRQPGQSFERSRRTRISPTTGGLARRSREHRDALEMNRRSPNAMAG